MGKTVVAFDLDDTLTASKSSLAPDMATLLCRLLAGHRVCVISGAAFAQFQTQLLDGLDAPPALLDRLHLMPTCGTAYYVHAGDRSWRQVYNEELGDTDKRRISDVLTTGARHLGLWEPNPSGVIIEDRGSQVTFSALGQRAGLEAKRKWDPDGAKREALRAYAAARLPGLEVRSGGTTSIDVTRAGIDKAYGMSKLIEHLSLSKEDILFFGDRLDEGGNDYPVKAMGIDTVAVVGWQDTAQVIRALLEADQPSTPA